MKDNSFVQSDKPFHLFLSYKSEDFAWVLKLMRALQERGVRVWLDKEQIRPGDQFARALEQGLELSRAMGLVVTPSSLESNWVQEEYYRALSLANENKLQLIPIIMQRAKLPGFLKGRQYVDFSDDRLYECSVDRLIWPGITGKRIVVAWTRPSIPCHGYTLPRQPFRRHVLEQLGTEVVDVSPGGGLNWWQRTNDWSGVYRPARHVVFVNPFEDDLDTGAKVNSPSSYADWIFTLREMTRHSENELAFVLYHRRNALDTTSELTDNAVERLRHYFTICHNDPADELTRNIRETWNRVQALLLDTEQDVTELNTVSLHEIHVNAIYQHGKFIRRMRLVFYAERFVAESDIQAYLSPTQFTVRFSGKQVTTRADAASCPFFTIKVEPNSDAIGLVPTQHNGVAFDPGAITQIQFESTAEATSKQRICLDVEFLR